MKQLLLVRHAKSGWSDASLRDIDRPLSERGERDAPRMGARLRRRKLLPQRVIASPARRALRTAQLLAAQLDYAAADIEIVDALYEARTSDWLTLIAALPGKLDCVLIVGHNPTVTELAGQLCPGANIDNMPTCGILQLDYDAARWRDIGTVDPHDWSFDFPKREPD